MKRMLLLLLVFGIAGCATDPRYAEHCRDAIGCGAYAVNPDFGPIQAQAVAPETGPLRTPFD